MASVQSLGVHKPSALPFLVSEEILPVNPPESAYRWQILSVKSSCGGFIEEELLTTEHCVVWSRAGIVERVFRFDIEKEPITQAVFTHFASPSINEVDSDDETFHEEESPAFPALADLQVRKVRTQANDTQSRNEPSHSKQASGTIKVQSIHSPRLSRALVVVLKSQAHVYFLSLTNHVVHLPFEVESVFPSYYGILFQRKFPPQQAPAPTPIIPVPPQNTFASPQSSNANPNPSFASSHSALPSGAPGGWATPLASLLKELQSNPEKSKAQDSPQIFYLLDPLTEVGRVVTRPDARSTSQPFSHLRPTDRLLYVSSQSEIGWQDEHGLQSDPLVLVVTVNEEENNISLHALTYLNQSPKNRGTRRSSRRFGRNSSHRRSSFASRLSTGATTPVARSFRHASADTALEDSKSNEQESLFDSIFDAPGASTRTSRRASSLLARSNLASSQDRATFGDLTADRHSKSGRREPSFGSRISQMSRDQGLVGFHGRSKPLSDIRSSLDSVTLGEQPTGELFDHLDDIHDAKALDGPGPVFADPGTRPDVMLQKLFGISHSVTGHSAPSGPADLAALRTFVLQAPGPDLADSSDASVLILCVMNRKLGELIIFHVKATPSKRAQRARVLGSPNAENYHFKVSANRRSGVLDAFKISDGTIDRILVLDKSGNSLTLQAPWTALCKIELPNPLIFHGRSSIHQDESPTQKREGGLKRVISEVTKGLSFLEHSTLLGRVDAVDLRGTRHRIEIQLQPSDAFVSRMVRSCQAVLPASEVYGESILRHWWDVMQWLSGREHEKTDKEWNAIVIVLFSMAVNFINDRPVETTTRQRRRKGGLLRSSSGANTNFDSWDEMMRIESGPSSMVPPWMDSQPWKWMRNEKTTTPLSSQGSKWSKKDIETPAVPMPDGTSQIHELIASARDFLKSSQGQAAVGNQGYSAIATTRDPNLRRTALASILVTLHLLREELKLDILSARYVHQLTPILVQLGTWLGWPNWSCHDNSFYMLENADMHSRIFDESTIAGLDTPAEPFAPPSILKFFESKISDETTSAFPTLIDVVGAPDNEREVLRGYGNSILSSLTPRTYLINSLLNGNEARPLHARIAQMAKLGAKLSLLETLPEGVAASFRMAMVAGQTEPSVTWSSQLLRFVGREDLATLARTDSRRKKRGSLLTSAAPQTAHDVQTICKQALELENPVAYDGSADVDRQSITRLLFRQDQRFAEAAKTLHPLHYPVAQCKSESGWSEADLLEAQQELAKVVAMRTLSVSLGRGLLFYDARLPLLTEKIPVHGFTLSSVMKPSDATVTADRAVFTEEKVSWAFFHAGVEAGLSISRKAEGIESSWIFFNKPRDLTNRHAGFLLALGLNGHLNSVPKWVSFRYLTPKHNMTSVGLLLGLCASHLGDMNTPVLKVLSVHLTCMLPPGSAELNLSPLAQTASLMGIGLLYCNTQHRRMSEIVLSEMETVDIEDGSNPVDPLRDEGYRLAAGFALGYINLGMGRDMKGLRDMRITERLLNLAISTNRLGGSHIADKATAGATIAVAIIFMKTDDQTLARKIDVPETVHQFDYVRPDHFLLRTLAKQLIMWSKIRPNHEWITSQMPSAFRHKAVSNIRYLTSEDLPFFNILTALCLSIGLRYAGTGSLEVRDILCSYLDNFIRICRLSALNYDQKLARITVRNCQDVVALSAASVMAGTGDLVTLRRLRLLHGRNDPETPYGSHLAAHFAIGALFVGGGTCTFGTSNIATASLLCAFYPLFPASVLDNKSHLQAFRHLWVLATERRCLIPRDVDTLHPLSIPIIVVTFQPSDDDGPAAATQQLMTAPCLLPPLPTISKIHISSDPAYWPVTLDFAAHPSPHLAAFRHHQSVFLKRRNGYDAASSASVFSATMQALNDSQTAHQIQPNPFEWLFTLPCFGGLDRAERALVLQPSGGGAEVAGWRGTVVDDRLMVESGTLGQGRSERLWNLRVLLKWAEVVEGRGEEMRWWKAEVVEGLRARLAVWRRQGR